MGVNKASTGGSPGFVLMKYEIYREDYNFYELCSKNFNTHVTSSPHRPFWSANLTILPLAESDLQSTVDDRKSPICSASVGSLFVSWNIFRLNKIGHFLYCKLQTLLWWFWLNHGSHVAEIIFEWECSSKLYLTCSFHIFTMWINFLILIQNCTPNFFNDIISCCGFVFPKRSGSWINVRLRLNSASHLSSSKFLIIVQYSTFSIRAFKKSSDLTLIFPK